MKIAIGVSSYALQKFIERYGDEILAYASERGEEMVREYGPQVVRWTANRGTQVYGVVAPRAADAAGRLAAIARRPSAGAVIPGAEEDESRRLVVTLFGPFAGTLEQIGAVVRAALVAAAGAGAERLRDVSDAEIGALAVALWRAGSRESLAGRRIRSRFRKETPTQGPPDPASGGT